MNNKLGALFDILVDSPATKLSNVIVEFKFGGVYVLPL